jgi:hypothetical protein
MCKPLLIGKWLATVVAFILLQAAIVSTSYAAPPTGGWVGDGDGGGGGDCGTYHEVRRGETLFSLGRQYGVYPYDIAQTNGLSNPDHIYAGQILYIPCTDGGGYGERPMQQPGGWQKPDMGPGMGQRQPQVGYGYDFTGYYYETYSPNYRRYSYTCGYHYNCY